MTTQEAISRMNGLKSFFNVDSLVVEAINLAIEALELKEKQDAEKALEGKE